MKKIFYILLIFIISLTFISCTKKEESIVNYKTKYVGDNSKVDTIVEKQKYPNNANKRAIKILSDEKPYSLNVYLDNYENVNKENLFKNAALTFALIDNLSNLNYYYLAEEDYKNENFDVEKVLANFNRNEVEEKLKENNMNFEKILKDEESLNKFLNI